MTTAAKIDLSGVYPPIVTPFNADESIAWDKLRSNISKWNEHPLAGFLVHGSNGEFCYLNTKERVEVIKAVKENAGPGKKDETHASWYTLQLKENWCLLDLDVSPPWRQSP